MSVTPYPIRFVIDALIFLDERFDLLYSIVDLHVPFYFITNYLEYIDRSSLSLMEKAEKILFCEYEDSVKHTYGLKNLEFIGPIFQPRKDFNKKKPFKTDFQISILLGGSKSLPAKIENMRLFYYLNQLPDIYGITVFGEEYTQYFIQNARYTIRDRSEFFSENDLADIVISRAGLTTMWELSQCKKITVIAPYSNKVNPLEEYFAELMQNRQLIDAVVKTEQVPAISSVITHLQRQGIKEKRQMYEERGGNERLYEHIRSIINKRNERKNDSE